MDATTAERHEAAVKSYESLREGLTLVSDTDGVQTFSINGTHFTRLNEVVPPFAPAMWQENGRRMDGPGDYTRRYELESLYHTRLNKPQNNQ